MSVYNLEKDGKLTVQTCLSKGQVSKFNLLPGSIIVDGNSAYLSVEKLHGILFTNSRQTGKDIVNNYYHIVRNYLVRDQNDGRILGVKPLGLYSLLEQLATDNPSRATQYRTSISAISCLISVNPELNVKSSSASREAATEQSKLISKLKRSHSFCQLSAVAFSSAEEKHAHHIVAASVAPDLIAHAQNILIIRKEVHCDYHNWASQYKQSIDRPSLIEYAQSKGYSTDYSHDLN